MPEINLSYFAYLVLLAMTAILGGLIPGYDNAIISGFVNVTDGDFYIISKETYLLISTVTKMLGALISSVLVDRRGRKWVIQSSSCLFVIGAVAASTPNSSYVVTGRILNGISLGMSGVAVAIFLSETSPPSIRGAVIALNGLSHGLGQQLACLVYETLRKNDWWRWMTLVACILSVVQWLLLQGLPESPKWQQQQVRLFEFLDRKVQEKMRSTIESSGVDWLQNLLSKIKRACSDVKVKEAIHITIILIATQQFAGLLAFTYHTPKLIREQSNLKVLGQTSLAFILSLVGNVLSMAIIDNVGRKKLINISQIVVVVSLILFGFRIPLKNMLSTIVFSKLLLIIYVLYTLAYSLGMEIVPAVVTAEVFPIQYRGLGGGLVALSYWIANAITSTTIVPTIKLLGSSSTVLLYAGFSVVGTFVVIQQVPETKGMSLEEIEEKSQTRRIKIETN